MTDLKTLRQTLRDLAGKANKEYPLECEPVKEGFVYDCPLCDGGQVDSEEAVTAFSQYAAGVQIFGIGDSLNNMEAYVHAANPENILRLLDALEVAETALETAEAALEDIASDRRDDNTWEEEAMHNYRTALKALSKLRGGR